MIDSALRKRLLQLLRQEALEFKEVTLSSGRRSNYYIDCRRATLSPEGAYLTAKLVLQHLPPGEVEALGGLTLGADPIVAAVAALSFLEGQPMKAFIVRKETKAHGQQHQIEGPHLEPGARVAIIDDVATTGGSILKAIQAVQEQTTWKIVRVLTLVDRQEGARERLAKVGYDLIAVFTGEELTRGPTT